MSRQIIAGSQCVESGGSGFVRYIKFTGAQSGDFTGEVRIHEASLFY